MLRKLLATALVLGICVILAACEKEEPTTGGSAPVQDPSGQNITPEGPGEGMPIEDPPTDDGQ